MAKHKELATKCNCFATHLDLTVKEEEEEEEKEEEEEEEVKGEGDDFIIFFFQQNVSLLTQWEFLHSIEKHKEYFVDCGFTEQIWNAFFNTIWDF